MAPAGVSWSMLVGGVISWGLLWPVLSGKEGSWYRSGLLGWDIRGVFGYHLCMAIALLLADALYHAVRATAVAVIETFNLEVGPSSRQPANKRKSSKYQWQAEALKAVESDNLSDASGLQFSLNSMERALRRHVFMSDATPWWIGALAYLVLLGVCVAVLPLLFQRSASWYHVLAATGLAPFFALANARGAGQTDVNLADSYGRIGLVIFGAIAGSAAGPAVGLVSSGVLLGAAYSGAELMYSFAAGYATMASPGAIFIAHFVGSLAGCAVAPAAWLLYYTPANAVGAAGSALSAPLAGIYRATAALATGGVGVLPANVQWLSLGALAVGLGLNLIREVVPQNARGIIPHPAAMGVVFLTGASIAVDLALGALIRFFWRLRYPRSADAYSGLVGAALICGDGMWALGRGLLGAFGVQPPICMTFSMP